MPFNIAAAADNRWGIGKNGRLLYPIPHDMDFFRRLTTGNTVIMGRKTLDSLPGGAPLSGRKNIVLTRDKTFSREGAVICSNVKELAEIPKDGRVFVIGGEEIYRLLLPYCSKAYITRINASFAADAFMPDLDAAGWRLIKQSEEFMYNGVGYRFQLMESPKKIRSNIQTRL